MRGILFKVLSSLTLLLLVGSTQLHAFNDSVGSDLQLENHSRNTSILTPFTFESTQVISVPFFGSNKGQFSIIAAQKVEEEEKTFSYLDDYFFYNPSIAVYPSLSVQSFSAFTKYQVFDTPYFSYLTFYNRCLIFEVFRL